MMSPLSRRLTLPTMIFSPRDMKVVEQLLALGIADLLQDHLLGGLGADAADGQRFDRLFDVVVDLDVGNLFLGFEEQDLGVGDLQTGLVGDDVPAAEGVVVAGLAIDGHADIDLAAVQLLGRRASAASTAPNTTSRSTLFSREIASTSINISRFILLSLSVVRAMVCAGAHRHLAASLADP